MIPLSSGAAMLRHRRRELVLPLACAVLSVAIGLAAPGAALAAKPTIDTSAKQAIMVDFATGTAMFEKNADQRMAPSSMSKMMTLYVLFEYLKAGRLKPDDTLPVSEKAWRMGGSKMFVALGSRVKVEDLIQGIAVQSGNDACVVVAEGLAGSEAAFAEIMNKKAADLGLKNSHFVDASGWPDPQQYMTARDLALLGRRLIIDFPQHYHYFSEIDYAYNGIKQGNRNPLLYKTVNVDGIKTGHTDDGGYGLTASAERNGRRLILVLNGMSSVNERSRESANLLEWGYREWNDYVLFKAGEKVIDANVWLGMQPTVPLVIDSPIVLTIPRSARDQLKVTVSYNGPIPAPVAKGAEVAMLEASTPDTPPVQIPLKTGADVEQLGIVGRISAALHHLVWGSGG